MNNIEQYFNRIGSLFIPRTRGGVGISRCREVFQGGIDSTVKARSKIRCGPEKATSVIMMRQESRKWNKIVLDCSLDPLVLGERQISCFCRQNPEWFVVDGSPVCFLVKKLSSESILAPGNGILFAVVRNPIGLSVYAQDIGEAITFRGYGFIQEIPRGLCPGVNHTCGSRC